MNHKSDTQLKSYVWAPTIFSWIHPYLLMLCGIATIIPFFFTRSLSARAIQVCVVFILAVQVKHVRVLYFVFITLSITIFYIVVPNGRVLLDWGVIKITETALKDGLYRGLTLNGYVFISLWCISPRLHLPTKYGRVLTLSIQYFYVLLSVSSSTEYKNFLQEQKRTKRKLGITSSKLAEKTDMLLYNALSSIHADTDTAFSHEDDTTDIAVHSRRKKIIGIVLLLCAISVSWWGMLL